DPEIIGCFGHYHQTPSPQGGPAENRSPSASRDKALPHQENRSCIATTEVRLRDLPDPLRPSPAKPGEPGSPISAVMGHRLIERDHTSPYQPWQTEVRSRDVPHQSRQDLTGPGGAEPNQHQLRQSTAYLDRVASPYQPRQTEVRPRD
ncbi:hypothetical protein NQZ68_036661, partial [Dissostichus eleginoides]